MDKNIVAFLREDVSTVAVRFEPEGKTYTYLTDRTDLKEGDTLVVYSRGKLALVEVERVDLFLNVEPKSDITYQWVVDKVDQSRFDRNQARNAEMHSKLREAYTAAMRKQAAAAIFGELGEEAKAELLAISKAGQRDTDDLVGDDPGFTYADVAAKIVALAKAKGNDCAKGILARFGAEHLAGVNPRMYFALVEDLEAELENVQ